MSDKQDHNVVSKPLPPVTPTLKQVTEQIDPAIAAAASSIADSLKPAVAEENKITVPSRTVDMNTSLGQTKLAETAVVGSQPSSNKPIEHQIQSNGLDIKSLPFDKDGNLLRPLTDDEILLLPEIVARNFDYSGDEIKVEAVDHNIVLHWVQCGNYNGAGTNWLARQIGKGYSYATADDIQDKYKEKFKMDSLGHFVIPPDLVLMKMPSIRYYSFIKGHMKEALERVSDKGAKERARAKAITDMQEGGVGVRGSAAPGVKNFANSLEKNKASFYDPTAGR